jgi:hypothetical protein
MIVVTIVASDGMSDREAIADPAPVEVAVDPKYLLHLASPSPTPKVEATNEDLVLGRSYL